MILRPWVTNIIFFVAALPIGIPLFWLLRFLIQLFFKIENDMDSANVASLSFVLALILNFSSVLFLVTSGSVAIKIACAVWLLFFIMAFCHKELPSWWVS